MITPIEYELPASVYVRVKTTGVHVAHRMSLTQHIKRFSM